MPIHDWRRVSAGTFHDFHLAWIAELRKTLNAGLLPEGYYAQAEQVSNKTIPDVLTLKNDDDDRLTPASVGNGVATLPEADVVTRYQVDAYLARKRRIIIRKGRRHRVVAIMEIVSRGNKSSRADFRQFIGKTVSAIRHGVHVFIIDLFRPGRRDPNGIPGAIADELGGTVNPLPADRQLTLSSYRAGMTTTEFVRQVAVGMTLPDMPLFLNFNKYVDVPLEATYAAAWLGMPPVWREVLESPD